MHPLILSAQTLSSSNREPIGGISPIRLNDGGIVVCMRQGRRLIGYQYVASTETWVYRWSELVFSQEGNYPLDRYPWLVADNLIPNENIILLRHPDGIQFYRLDSAKPGLKLLAEDIKFHEFFSGSLLWGHFYPNASYVGVMTRDVHSRIKFYASTLRPKKPPLSPLKIEVPSPSWSTAEAEFLATRLYHNDSEVIGLRTAQGLEFYQFNADYLLEKVIGTAQITKSTLGNAARDHLFFGDLTHQMYQDILHLNESGLFVYQHNHSQKDYRLLHRHTGFTQPYGWLPHYADSIRLIDLNGDSRDDLLFTGKEGITALSFDAASKKWQPLLHALSGAQRYAGVVGALPAMSPTLPYPSLFMQDTDTGKVQWAKVMPAPTTTTAVPTTTTTSAHTTIGPSRDRNSLAPEQIIRTNLPEKPMLRWAEQWDDGFLKETVDPASGQARFSIPLIDIFASTGWRLQLALSYNSQVRTADLLGIGWWLPLAQDYIFVDHQGSIYPEDARYYLMAEGRPELLKFMGTHGGVQRFQLADEGVQITYNPSEQHWIIEGSAEQITYGKVSPRSAQDALQWSLGWPTWRGIGRDTAQQQPFVTAWYLSKRLDKDNQRTLYYRYEKDSSTIANGKTYDAALRLKTIEDGQYMKLNVDYAPKERSEYTPPNPVDREGNIIFPIPLARSHYLQGYSLTTAAYSQTLKFVYQVNDGKRLLTAIEQPSASHTEPILKFSYRSVLDTPVLQSCRSLPKETTVRFSYQSITPPASTVVPSYPMREKAKIAYGSDYAIMAYRDLNPRAGKVVLRIMNRAMTQVIMDCSLDSALSCPSAESDIKDFAIQAYPDSFVVFTESSQKRTLHLFNRHGKTWSTVPTTYRFGNQALVRFSETVIAAAEPNERVIMLFTRADNQSDWREQALTLPRAITALALHNRLIVGYDDHQLRLFHYDVQAGWQNKWLDSKSNGLGPTLDLFDLESEARQQVLTALNQNSLQILNNCILLNTIQENQGQLSLHTHLFLLDAHHNIAKKKSFEIKRENIHNLTYEHKDNDSIYKIGYVKKQGRFKAQIKAISGKIIEELITNYKITNKNIKEDFRAGTDSRVQEQIKQLNQAEEWKEVLKKTLFIDSSVYAAQIGQQGVYVGHNTLLRITGTGWVKESLTTTVQKTNRLGKYFVLETDRDDQSLFKLYHQNSNQKKQGDPLQTLQLHAPGQLINQYPAYIAYHPAPNLVKVLTFKDEQTLGPFYSFKNEQLLPGSDFQNLITAANASSTTMVHAESQECRVRAVSTLLPPKVQSFVNQVTLAAGDIQRITAYERSFNAEGLTYTETATIVPGNNKNAYGWHEATRSSHKGNVTKTERWFNADGSQVLPPPESPEKPTQPTAPTPNPMLLLDRSGKWLVSDFSPYSLADEMVAYYGFEPYEKNQIGFANATAKAWRSNQAQTIKGNFAFTGEHYLRLKGHSSFLEGVFQPSDQETTYLAACWIRCPAILDTAYLRAIVHTSNGQKIIGLKSQVKHQLGDWSYLELPLNFQVLRQIYRDYFRYRADDNSALPLPKDAVFRITLRVEAPDNQIVDLDHIRFAPLAHDFQAAVYHPLIGRPTAVIQANGLVVRTIYNHLQQEIANTDEEGQLQEFSSSSRTGKLVPSPQGSKVDAKPNVITFEPAYGSYETFDTSAWHNRWQLDNPAAWRVATGQLWHKHSENHRMEAMGNLFDGTSAAMRCYFALQESRSALALNWEGIGSVKFTRQSDHSMHIALPNGQSITGLPSAGELIVMLEQHYLWLWLDGVLLVDQALPVAKPSTVSPFEPWSSFALDAQGAVLVEDYLIMNRPQVTVKYYNAFSEKTQVIQLADAQTAQVSEVLYDALGREAITTKTTRIKRNAGQSLLAYRPDFVNHKNPTHRQSVWHTGILQGEVHRLNLADQGFAYTRTEYAPNPLDQEQTLGLPGPDFSITGPYATKIRQHSDVPFLDNLFPVNQGYRQKVEHTPNGNLNIAVFDPNNNQVAKYVRVASYNHLLSTYEYDGANRLIKILPPLYHEKVDTAARLTAWQFGEDHLSSEEKKYQQALAMRFTYDRHGRLRRKITPDGGTTAYLYNAAGQRRFMVSFDEAKQAKTIVYFNYDGQNQLIGTGHISSTLSLTTLGQYLENNDLPDAQAYQTLDHSDDHFDPLLRGRDKQYITHNDAEVSVVEKLRFDAQQQVISKKAILTQAELAPLTNIEKQYVHGKLRKLIYPIKFDNQPLDLVHSYDRLGQLIGLGTSRNPTYYASFGYRATGQLANEQYQPGRPHSFTRSYGYNAPGFLERISDPFLTEELTYTDKGYGQAGYGDGMVMQATFNASWPVNVDGRWFQIRESDLGGNDSALCIKALKRTGYLTDSGQPIKLYVREAETALPLVCGGATGRDMATLIAKKQKPTYYGHRYAYGNHQELVKAKYITGDTDKQPLQPNSFAKEIPGLTHRQSQDIWQLLTRAGYIITDQQRNDPATAVGKRGVTFFRSADLRNDLAALHDGYTLYVQPLERFIVAAIGQQRIVTLTDFEAAFLHWQGLDLTSSRLIYTWQKEIANKIGQMLLNKGYLPTHTADLTRPLNSHFTRTLRPYAAFVPKIVETLSQHFAHGLGQTAFDVESYEIDANGNHRLFYTGFNRHALTYRNDTNQIESIKLDWPIELNALEGEKVFAMKHDAQGNVIQALHKKIQRIEYHPVSQRTTRIQLTDDRTLRFYYDAQGERVLKRVFDAAGKMSRETHYLRDEQGRVLMDRQTTYLDGSTQKISTAYLYGPRGLLGFIRKNGFYSTTTDHAGSVRLVIKDGKVVAAYDYLPYGGLMRSYGNDPEAHIVYRYTGQEWDEETGLYNYHARLYDPSIGRFYQIDPKAQYVSPYKYAGNSPISVVDPDGELAFLLTCIALAITGAYLGGAAANNRWNPVDWDFKDSGTWLGIGGGAIAGGLLPLGFGASVSAIGGLAGTAVGTGVLGTTLTATGMTIGVSATLGLGMGMAYVTTAAASGSWDPAQWKWDRPDTWSGLFQGFSGGSGIAGGVAITHSFAHTGKAIRFLGNIQKLQAIGIGQRTVKGVFLTVSYTAGGGVAYARAGAANTNFAFWEWDWTNAATWSGLVDGFDTGMGWPQNIMEMGRGAGRLAKNPKKYLFSGQKKFKLQSILKDSNHPLRKATTGVVMGYFMGSAANGDFDITKWNLAVFSTYEGVLNGIFFGKDITKTLRYIHNAKVQDSSNALVHVPKNKAVILSGGIKRMLDAIQTSRIGAKFQDLVVRAFAKSDVWLSKLTSQSSATRSQVENFFKGGVRKWKSGENRPPQELQRLIAEEAKLKVQEDAALTIWKAESEEVLRKQQEVFPEEEDGAFLNCKRARRRKRADGTDSKPFQFKKIEDQPYTDKPSQYKLEVRINGGELIKTSADVYKYIEEKHSDTMMPDKQKFITDHQNLINNGYVLVGYHGTNEIAALSIVSNNEFQPTIINNKHHWDGVYAAENLKLALENYANDIEDSSRKKHARVLAVYAKKEDIKNIGLTIDNIRDIFGNEADGHTSPRSGFNLNKNKASSSIIAGKDSSSINLNEMVIKEGIDLRATVLPIITEDDFKNVENFFKLQDIAQNVIKKHEEDIPFLEDIKPLRDLSPENKEIVKNTLEISGVHEIKDTLNILEDLGLAWENTERIEDLLKIKNATNIKQNLQFLLEYNDYNYKDFDDNATRDIENIIKQNDLAGIIHDFRSFKASIKLDDLSSENKTRIEDTLKLLKDLEGLSFEDKKIVEAIFKFNNQDFSSISNENKKIVEAIFKIKDSTTIKNSIALLKNLKLPEDIENIFKTQEVTKIKDTLKLLDDNSSPSQEDREIMENIFKIQDTIKIEDNDGIKIQGNYHKIKEILNLKRLSNNDFYRVMDYFMRQNNLFNAVKDFQSIKGFLEFKRLLDNELKRAKELLNLDELSEAGFKGLRDYLFNQQYLVDSIEDCIKDYEAIREILSSDKLMQEHVVEHMKSLLVSESIHNTHDFNKAITDIVKLKEHLQKNDPTTRLTTILEFYGKGDFASDNSDIETMSNIFYPNANAPNKNLFNKDDFKAVIGYFLARKNNLFSAIGDFQSIKDVIEFKHLSNNDLDCAKKLLKSDKLSEAGFKSLRSYFVGQQNMIHAIEDFQSIKDVIEFKHLSDNDLDDAKRLLNLDNLSEAGFKSLRSYFVDQLVDQQNMIHAAKDFKNINIKILLETTGLQAVQNIKNILSSGKDLTFTKKDFDFFDPKVRQDDLIKQKNIPLDHTLHYALQDARDGDTQVYYYCAARSKRSIKPIEKYEALYFIDIHDIRRKMDPKRQLSDASIDTTSIELENVAVTNSASRLTPWTNYLLQIGKNLVHKVIDLYYSQETFKPTRDNSNHLYPSSNTFDNQRLDAPQHSPTVLEMGDRWIKNTDANGLLTWGTLLARKWTGYRPKVVEAPSYDPTTDITLDIRSQELVHAFMDKVQEHAQACGMEQVVSSALENPTLYTQAIHTVRKKLAAGQVDDITPSLFEQVVEQNLNAIAATATTAQAAQLWASVMEDLPNLEQQALEEASPENEYQEEVPSESNVYQASSPAHAAVNIDLLKQDMCKMESVDQLAAASPLRTGTTYNMDNIFVPNGIENGNQYRKCCNV